MSELEAGAPLAPVIATLGRLYSITEAAEILNVPRTWLRDKVTARAVPHTRLGRHVRFSDAHLAAIIQAGEKGAAVPAPRVEPSTIRRRRATRETRGY
jgi:excisionase family DNA binding protein